MSSQKYHRQRPADGSSKNIERLFKLISHRWLGGRFARESETAIARLLVGISRANAQNEPIHKKAAAAVIGAEDARTARKYVTLAVKKGLLRAQRSPTDKRNELLVPTPLLGRILEREYRDIAALFGVRSHTEKQPVNIVMYRAGVEAARNMLEKAIAAAEKEPSNAALQADKFKAWANFQNCYRLLLNKEKPKELINGDELVIEEAAILFRRAAEKAREAIDAAPAEQRKAIALAEEWARVAKASWDALELGLTAPPLKSIH